MNTVNPIRFHLVDDEYTSADIAAKAVKKVFGNDAPITLYNRAAKFKAAVHDFDRNAFHCVLSDYNMPGGDAPDVCDAIDDLIRTGFDPKQIAYIGTSSLIDQQEKLVAANHQDINAPWWNQMFVATARKQIGTDQLIVDTLTRLLNTFNSAPPPSSSAPSVAAAR